MIEAVIPRKRFIKTIKEVARLTSLPEDKLQAELDQSDLSTKTKYWLLKIVTEELKKIHLRIRMGKENDISNEIKNAVLKISDKQSRSFEELVNGLERLVDSDISTSEEGEKNQAFSTSKTLKFIAPELQEFLCNYRIKNKLTQEQIAELLKLSEKKYTQILAGAQYISPTLEENLRVYFYKDYQHQITTALKTCVDLPSKNNVSLLIYYIRTTENISIEDIAKKLNVDRYHLGDIARTKTFLTRRVAIALKEYILNIPNLPDDILNLCNEVLFCCLIHVFRVKLNLSLADFAKQLNISYELLLKIEKAVSFAPAEVKEKFAEIIVSAYGKDFALKFDDITIKPNEIKPKTLSNKREPNVDIKNIQINKKEDTEPFISSELYSFILSYIKDNNKKLNELAEFTDLTVSDLYNILDAETSISNTFKQKLFDWFPKEYHSQLQQNLNTCIEIPRTNNFELLVSSYKINNDDKYYNEILRLLKTSWGTFSRLFNSSAYISIDLAQNLKNLIISDPKSDNIAKNLCDEVIFSATIHYFRIKHNLSLADFAKDLNISYEQLLKIEKTVINVPNEVKEKFAKLTNSGLNLQTIDLLPSDINIFMSPELKQFIYDYIKNNDLTIKEFAKLTETDLTNFYSYLSAASPIINEFKLRLYNAIPKELHTELQQKLQTCIEIPKRNNFGLVVVNYMTNNNIGLETVATKLYVSTLHLGNLTNSRHYVPLLLAQSLKDLIIKDPKSSANTVKLCDEVIFSALLNDYIQKRRKNLRRNFPILEFANKLGISYKELLLITKTVIAAPDKVKQKFYSETKLKPAESK